MNKDSINSHAEQPVSKSRPDKNLRKKATYESANFHGGILTSRELFKVFSILLILHLKSDNVNILRLMHSLCENYR